jgi:hypothetical protein
MKRPASQEHLYRFMLRLYPTRLRERFGDEMVQLFGDQLREARSGQGSSAAGFWLRTLGDLVTTAVSERTRTDRSVAHSLVAPSTLNRVLGAIGILGGLVLVAALIPGIPWSWAVFNLRLVLFELGAIAIVVAVHGLQAARGRWLSLVVGAACVLANAWHMGMSVLFVTRPQPPAPDPEFRPLYAIAANTMWVSNALFGLVALRLGVISSRGTVVLTVGSLLAATGVSGNLSHELSDALASFTVAGVVMVGVAWILLGIEVATRRRAVATGPQPAERRT